MKQHLRSFLTLLMLVVWASGFAADKTYSYTFKSGDFSAKKKTSTLNGVNWTLGTTCTKFGFDTQYSRGFAIGSSQVNPKNPVYSTSEISGTIKEITVNAACNANKSVDLEVTVNNVAYSTGSTSSTKVALTKSSTNYTFTGGASGEIKIKYTTSDKTAVYIKSIKVIYEDGPTKTLKSLAISGDATKKAYNDGDAFDPTGLVVTGTYDDNTTATITNGITWATTPTKLTVGTTSCSVTATVNGVTSPAYNVTGLTVTKTISLTIDPATSTVVKAPVKVTLTADDGATIYYTTNGEEPTTTSTKYTAPFEVTKSGTKVKALAVAEGAEDVKAEATYTIKPDQPVFSDESKTFNDAFNVTLSLPESTDATSTIHYTIGKDATAESPLYEGPINISAENDGDKVILRAVVVDKYGNVGKQKYCTYTKTTAVVFDFKGKWEGITPGSNNKDETAANVVAGKELKVDGIVMTATNGKEYMTCLIGSPDSHELRVYSGGSITFTAPEGYNITNIDFDGKKLNNFNQSEGNYKKDVTTATTWTGNAHEVTFTATATVNVNTATIKLVTTTIPLNETTTAEDAKTLLGANLNKTVNVTINRTLVANKWNTLCLPFDVTAEQIKNILKAEGMVREYKDQNGDCINFQAAETMTAGVPYLIKPTEEVKGLTFEGVKITATEGVAKGAETGSIGENLSICGVLGAKALSTDGSDLFLNADGKFVAPAEGKQTMRGFRAYFMSLLGTEAKINIDGETTGINNIETEATVNGKVYNLNGQYVGNSLNGLKKGIYVVNGKKVIK